RTPTPSVTRQTEGQEYWSARLGCPDSSSSRLAFRWLFVLLSIKLGPQGRGRFVEGPGEVGEVIGLSMPMVHLTSPTGARLLGHMEPSAFDHGDHVRQNLGVASLVGLL